MTFYFSPVPEKHSAAMLGWLQWTLNSGVGLRSGPGVVWVLRQGSASGYLSHLDRKKGMFRLK